MRTSRLWRSLKGIAIGLGIGLVLTTTTPTPSHAIPLAGDYAFTAGFTGTFTSNGSKLTEWNFTDSLGTSWTFDFDDGSMVLTNNAVKFDVLRGNREVVITWDNGSAIEITSPVGRTTTAVTWAATGANVPEAPTGSLVTLGLLALLGYGWRQRRQAGLQIG